MKILLSGATGFIGSHLLPELISQKHEVFVVTRRSTHRDSLLKVLPEKNILCDEGSTESWIKKLESIQPQVMIHLASNFIPQHQPEDTNSLVESNISFPLRILEALKSSGCKTLINTGTSWQHFESDQYRPVNLYASTKQAFEDIARFYSDAYGLQVINLKLFDTYGEGDKRKKLLALLKNILQTKEELALSPGEQLIDLLHVDDVVKAFTHCLNNLNQFDKWCSYAVGSQDPLPLKKLVETFECAAGEKLNVQWGVRPYREREVMKTWDGPQLPGWQPQVKLDEGLKRFLNA